MTPTDAALLPKPAIAALRMQPGVEPSFPATYIDRTGQRCVWVPLTNSADSWTTTVAAYRELMQVEGITGQFRLQHHARAARQVVTDLTGDDAVEIARLIAKAGPAQRVRFDNKQSLDLRPRNLILIAGAPIKEHRKPLSEAALRFLAQLKEQA